MAAPRIGLVHGMDAAEYHAGPEVSNSILSTLKKSAAHCWAMHLDPARPVIESTPAMRNGTMTHAAILEPESFDARYIVRPDGIDYRTNAGKAWRDSQTAEIITLEDAARVQAQRAAILRVPALASLLRSGKAEASAFWTDRATGLLCRARPDWLHPTGAHRAIALDIKTISDHTPDFFSRAIAAYGYHRQAAFYSDGLAQCGIEVEEFVFGVVSSTYPFIAAAYVLDDESASQSRDEIAELLQQFADCKASGQWPAFGDGYTLTTLPTWAKRSSEIELEIVQ